MSSNSSSHPEEMPRWKGHAITIAVFFFPAVLLWIFGLAVGNDNTAMGFATLWLGIIAAVSIQIKRKTTFTVVERFGLLWDIKFAGFRVIIPWIDNVIMEGDFLQKSVQLFKDGDTLAAIDFKDGTAPVKAVAWYQIGNPEDVRNGKHENLREQILNYTYRLLEAEREPRVAKIFGGEFRALLEQGMEITEAQKDASDLAKQAAKTAEPALKEIGIFPFPDKGIIVEDIVLPEEITALRQQKQKGQADAEEANNRARSYVRPVITMKEELEKAGVAITTERLVDLFVTQKGFETLKDTKSNITLVASDVRGALLTIDASNKKGGTP